MSPETALMIKIGLVFALAVVYIVLECIRGK